MQVRCLSTWGHPPHALHCSIFNLSDMGVNEHPAPNPPKMSHDSSNAPFLPECGSSTHFNTVIWHQGAIRVRFRLKSQTLFLIIIPWDKDGTSGWKSTYFHLHEAPQLTRYRSKSVNVNSPIKGWINKCRTPKIIWFTVKEYYETQPISCFYAHGQSSKSITSVSSWCLGMLVMWV